MSCDLIGVLINGIHSKSSGVLFGLFLIPVVYSISLSVFFVVVSSFSLNVILGLWFYFPPFADGVFLSVALAFFFNQFAKITVLFLPFHYLYFFFMFLFILFLEYPVHSQIKAGDNGHPQMLSLLR